MQLRFYNTLSKTVEEFAPARTDMPVRIYSCGPTVYDHAHIGNLRAFLIADLLQRVVRVVGGYNVSWVMNITDIDDKTIAGSAPGSPRWLPEMGTRAEGPLQNLSAFTRYYTQQFLEDLSAVGIREEHFYAMPRATDFIPQMQQLVREIYTAGFAYESDGSVYFNVAAYSAKHEYGRLFTIDTQNFKSGVRIDADEYDRESVSDFVLWKAQKVGEPYWDFEWVDEKGTKNLRGRPGWHLECSAMSRELLGPLPFDLHTGAVDLRFPHHEDELAQCCAAHSQHTGNNDFSEQSNVWVHNEFLEVDGKKMSKSLGNFYTLKDLQAQGIDAIDVRFAILGAHYRSVFNYTSDGVRGASAARKRVQEYIWDLIEVASQDSSNHSGHIPVFTGVLTALATDMHTPKALAELYSCINAHPAHAVLPQQAAGMVEELRTINGVFQVFTFDRRIAATIPHAVRALADERWNARLQKQWAESDRLRDALLEAGYAVKDGKDGYDLTPLQ